MSSLPDRAAAEALAERLRSLAVPARLQLLACLRDGETSVAELERRTGLKQPGLSQQLGELRQAGWVSTRRQARSVLYSLAEPSVGLLLAALSALLLEDGGAERLAAALATPGPGPGPASGGVEAAVFARVGRAA
jgi:DNA-binding transcriptional ArsR family regulator